MEHRPELPLYRDLNSSAETLSELLPPQLRQALTILYTHYPFCSLFAEWVTTHQNQAVVRAVIQSGSVCLASAIASADQPEEAEDQAKLRAIATLLSQHPPSANQHIGPSVASFRGSAPEHSYLNATPEAAYPKVGTSASSNQLAEEPAMHPQANGTGAPALNPIPAIAPPADPSPLASVPPSDDDPGVLLTETSISTHTGVQTDTPQDEAAFLQTPSWDEFESDTVESFAAESPAPTVPLDASIDSAKPTPAKRKAASQPNPKKSRSSSSKSDRPDESREQDEQGPTPSAEMPTDLSDIIARTSVELKRLGWTDVQGREYLQKAYGKRSRQQLTDPELLDFLNYLETQPSPNVSPF